MAVLHTDMHKVGDSFCRVLTIPQEFADGYFLDWVAQCEVRSQAGLLLSTCECTWAEPAAATRHLYVLERDTGHWPANASLLVDVQFTRVADRYVMSTTTAVVRTTADVTEHRS